jgi:AAA ATPase domain
MEIKNDGRLKICWMRLVGYQQFQDVFLDFTHPETGEPLDKICLIGANGTGKTVVLDCIFETLSNFGTHRSSPPLGNSSEFLTVSKFIMDGNSFLAFCSDWESGSCPWTQEIERTFKEMFNCLPNLRFPILAESVPKIATSSLKHLEQTLIAYSPAESAHNGYLTIEDVPNTTLAEAVWLKEGFPVFHLVDSQSVDTFWKTLLYQCHIRREAQESFERQEENLDRTKRELVADFDSWNPKILEELGKIWDLILAKAGLEFDVANAKIPFQPLENLKAYIISKQTKEKVPYNKLSTGIRNYIFRLGHIYSLYFQRNILRGQLLVDEPENGLFPDFLYDLVDVYRQVTTDKNGENNTQMFFATHEPIIAAQFEPYERIILEWNDDGTVRTRRGYSPIGDDPNDLLKKDFAVASLMGEKGNAAWKKFLQLSDLLDEDLDAATKKKVMDEYMEIGNKYNFPAS